MLEKRVWYWYDVETNEFYSYDSVLDIPPYYNGCLETRHVLWKNELYKLGLHHTQTTPLHFVVYLQSQKTFNIDGCWAILRYKEAKQFYDNWTPDVGNKGTNH